MRYTPLKTWYNIDNYSIDNLLYMQYTPLKTWYNIDNSYTCAFLEREQYIKKYVRACKTRKKPYITVRVFLEHKKIHK